MRLAEEIEQIRKRRRSDEAHGDGPAQKLLVPPAVRSSHSRQQVIAVFFFALPRPKHKRSLVRVVVIVKPDGFGKRTCAAPHGLERRSASADKGERSPKRDSILATGIASV